jgi:shikimate dehydrogenase
MSKKFKLGVIGNPIEHSLSPFIHSRFAREQNLNIDYQAYKVEEGNFDNFISEFFSDKSSRGLNVTLPLKNLAANIEGEISEEAKFINAVNTITKSNRNFKLESTDGMGFMTDLKHKEIDIARKKYINCRSWCCCREYPV